nr:MAG TPA: hypothetical protein [Caudoviricetes sp.]
MSTSQCSAADANVEWQTPRRKRHISASLSCQWACLTLK